MSYQIVNELKKVPITNLKLHKYYQICSLPVNYISMNKCIVCDKYLVRVLLYNQNLEVMKIDHFMIPKKLYNKFIEKIPPQNIEIIPDYRFDNVRLPNFQQLQTLISPLLN